MRPASVEIGRCFVSSCRTWLKSGPTRAEHAYSAFAESQLRGRLWTVVRHNLGTCGVGRAPRGSLPWRVASFGSLTLPQPTTSPITRLERRLRFPSQKLVARRPSCGRRAAPGGDAASGADGRRRGRAGGLSRRASRCCRQSMERSSRRPTFLIQTPMAPSTKTHRAGRGEDVIYRRPPQNESPGIRLSSQVCERIGHLACGIEH